MARSFRLSLATARTRRSKPVVPRCLPAVDDARRGCLTDVAGAELTLLQRGEANVESELAALDAMPDDALLKIIAACSERHIAVPQLEAVRGLCVCKEVLQQLYRLRPIVRVRLASLDTAQRLLGHGLWRVVVWYTGELTAPVLDHARRARVRSIEVCSSTFPYQYSLAPAVARRVVPELLSAGCSLLELKLEGLHLNRSWEAIFGEEAVCSEVLRELQLDGCRLRGELPELRLPALQALYLTLNHLNGGLEPLQGCTAIRELDLSDNQLSGGLEPLKGCTALRQLYLTLNQLSGGLEPLQGCTELQALDMSHNRLTGGLAPLMGCWALQGLDLYDNQLTGGLDALQSCTNLQRLDLSHNHFWGGLEPLKGCTKLRELYFFHNQLVGGLEPLRDCTGLQRLDLSHNELSGDLEPLRGCTELVELYLFHNQFTGGLEPLQGCTAMQTLDLSNNQLTGGVGPLMGCKVIQTLNLANNRLTLGPRQRRIRAIFAALASLVGTLTRKCYA